MGGMAVADQLVVLLKAPRPGLVKTRLAARLGVDEATRAYRCLVEGVLKNVSGLPGVELRYAPDEAAAELSEWQRPGWTLAPQGDGDFGARLVRAFEENFAAGARRVVVIGADCPYVGMADLAAAFAALAAADVVLGPAVDGGYWLIGLHAPQPGLFRDIAWSTAAVLAQTERRATSASLTVARLRTLSDVDTEADWLRWLEPANR